MAICLTCYHPIEAEKLKALPDARYCIACAKKRYLGNGDDRKPTQQDLFQQEVQRELAEEQRKVLRPALLPLRVNGKGKHHRPAVLKEEVFDDCRPSQATILIRKGKKHKKASKKPAKSVQADTAAWRYTSDDIAKPGDVIFTENSMCAEFNHLWVVDTVETNMVACHCEDKPAWKHTFYIRSMTLITRKLLNEMSS